MNCGSWVITLAQMLYFLTTIYSQSIPERDKGYK